MKEIVMAKYVYECPNKATCGHVEYGNASIPRNCPKCGQLMLPRKCFNFFRKAFEKIIFFKL